MKKHEIIELLKDLKDDDEVELTVTFNMEGWDIKTQVRKIGQLHPSSKVWDVKGEEVWNPNL